MLADRTQPGALLTLGGDIIATTLDSEDTAVVNRVGFHLPKPPEEGEGMDRIRVDEAGRSVALQLLRAVGHRPVGWLATVEAPPPSPSSTAAEKTDRT